ncbi:MAG: DMT family transporter [Dehalococcoidia bacterium]|nr:DMT family transporter [Dehalococcoidia bacterium]
MRAPQLIGLIALAAIWGASFMFIKVMLDEMGPVAVGWVRLVGGASLLLAVVAARRTPFPRGGRRLWDFLVLGALASAVPFFLIPWGEQRIDSGLAAVLNASMPLFVAPLAHRFLVVERLIPRRALGLALGFVGVVVVIGPDLLDVARDSTRGQLAVVLASASYAAGAIWMRRRLLDVDTTMLAALQTAAACLWLTPLLFAFESPPVPWELSTRVLLATAALAFLASGIAFIIYYWILATASATQAAMVTYLAPVAALFWGWAVLDEVVATSSVPGLALIIGGVWLVSRAPTATSLPAPEAEFEPSV